MALRIVKGAVGWSARAPERRAPAVRGREGSHARVTEEAVFEVIAEDEPSLDDADLPTDDEEDDDPAPRDAAITPVDPDGES